MIICCCECVLSLKMHHEPIKMVCIEILSNYYSFMAQCYENVLVWKSFINFDPNMLSSLCTHASKFLQYRKRISLTLIEWVGLFHNFAFCRFSIRAFNTIVDFLPRWIILSLVFSNSFKFISKFWFIILLSAWINIFYCMSLLILILELLSQ